MPVPTGPDSYDLNTPTGQVRVLINDTSIPDVVFSDPEIFTFLALEGEVVKLAAALAYETIAADEALTSKVIRTQDLSTDGAKLSAELRAHAARWRQQVAEAADADDYGFEMVDIVGDGPCVPELTEHNPYLWPRF